jgi:hypothetical protein
VLVNNRGALAVANQSPASQMQVPETMSTLDACGPVRLSAKAATQARRARTGGSVVNLGPLP